MTLFPGKLILIHEITNTIKKIQSRQLSKLKIMISVLNNIIVLENLLSLKNPPFSAITNWLFT